VIEESAFERSDLKSVSIPYSVVSLETKCFARCRELTRVVFEADSKLSDVGSEIFAETPKLERIEIPETMVAVCQRVFRDELKWGLIAITGSQSD
jgi:hypothetical protein